MSRLTDEQLDYYGDRFIALGLRQEGITFEQYLLAPQYVEEHIAFKRVARVRTAFARQCEVAQ